MCIGVAIRGLSRSIVVYGGLPLQIQSLKLNLCPLFVCTVFAQQFRRGRLGQKGAKGCRGGLKAWDSQLTEFQSLSSLCAVRYAHR